MSDKFRIRRYKQTLSLTAGAGANTASNTFVQINGILWEAVIITPAAVDGAATVTINIIDADNITVYTRAGLAANTTTKDLLTGDLRIPLCGLYTIQVVFSANQTATSTTTTAILLIDQG